MMISSLRPCRPQAGPACRRLAAARRRKDQRGAVLVVALVLVLVMSLLGTFAIRNATQSERSVNGVRSAEISREAAETALRFCEQVAIFDADGKDYTAYGTASEQLRGKIIATPVTSEIDASASWRVPASWTGTNVIKVPQPYFMKFDGSAPDAKVPQLNNAPLCLIQKLQSTGVPPLKGYLITGRGFANNARFDPATGKTSQGAEAWLQSVLTQMN